jgi:hypothetical protein
VDTNRAHVASLGVACVFCGRRFGNGIVKMVGDQEEIGAGLGFGYYLDIILQAIAMGMLVWKLSAVILGTFIVFKISLDHCLLASFRKRGLVGGIDCTCLFGNLFFPVEKTDAPWMFGPVRYFDGSRTGGESMDPRLLGWGLEPSVDSFAGGGPAQHDFVLALEAGAEKNRNGRSVC